MTSQENQTDNDFEASGLKPLTEETKWHDERYRRSVMASLVKGVYVLKDDRRRNRQGNEALAPLWWKSFNFKLVHSIMADGDCSIIGAVYQYNEKSNNYYDHLKGFLPWHMLVSVAAFICIIQCIHGTLYEHNPNSNDYFDRLKGFSSWHKLLRVTAFICIISSILRILSSILNLLFKKKTSGAPTYVIAFRGTSLRSDSFIGDMTLNMNLLVNKLHHRSRFGKAMQAVEQMVTEKGADNVWLTGHSLGAAIAMLAGKTMAKKGVFLESYLYNPPFIAAPIESIRSSILKYCFHAGCTIITVGLTAFLQNNEERQQSEDLFTTLSPWVPNLFLHPDDFICSGYISYFELQETFESWGLKFIGNMMAHHSWQGLFMNAIGVDYWSEESHLIPSACVTTSDNPESHKLRQWFTDDSVTGPAKIYRY